MLLNFFLRNKNIGFLLLSSVFYFSINAFLNKYVAENFGTNGLLEFNYALNLFAILFAVNACFGSETALVRQSIFFLKPKTYDGFKELYSAISFFKGILISIPVIIFFLIYYFQQNFEMIIASSVIIFSAFFTFISQNPVFKKTT